MWALVLGIITLALSPIPILNQGGILVGFVACGLAIPALVIGFKYGTRRGMAIAGAVLAVLGLILSFVITASYVSAIDKAFAPVTSGAPGDGTSTDGNTRAAPLSYDLELTSTNLKSASGVTWSNSTGGTDQVTTARLPWRKTVTIGQGHVVSLTASTPSEGNGGSLTCTIRQAGKVVDTKTSSGEVAISDCTAFPPSP